VQRVRKPEISVQASRTRPKKPIEFAERWILATSARMTIFVGAGVVFCIRDVRAASRTIKWKNVVIL
jgi:hypothetical protein